MKGKYEELREKLSTFMTNTHFGEVSVEVPRGETSRFIQRRQEEAVAILDQAVKLLDDAGLLNGAQELMTEAMDELHHRIKANRIY